MNPSILSTFGPDTLPAFACVLTRVSGLSVSAPLWSMNGVPFRVRAAVTVALSLVLLPAVPKTPMPELLLLPVGLGVEFLIGLLIGLTAAVIVQGAALAGEILALQMGLALGESISPMSDVLVPGVGQLKSLLALLIYIGVDGHLLLLRGLADGFHVIPPGTAVTLNEASVVAADLLGTVYTAGLRLAAPAMVSLLLVNIGMGIASRAVPQLPAILVLFPLTIGLGLIVVLLALPSLSGVIAGWMTELPRRTTWVLDALRAAP